MIRASLTRPSGATNPDTPTVEAINAGRPMFSVHYRDDPRAGEALVDAAGGEEVGLEGGYHGARVHPNGIVRRCAPANHREV